MRNGIGYIFGGVFFGCKFCKICRKKRENVSSKKPMVWLHSSCNGNHTAGSNILKQKINNNNNNNFILCTIFAPADSTRGKKQPYFFYMLSLQWIFKPHTYTHSNPLHIELLHFSFVLHFLFSCFILNLLVSHFSNRKFFDPFRIGS